MITDVVCKGSLAHIFYLSCVYVFEGPGAAAAARVRDLGLVWRRRGLIPVQRVRAEEGAATGPTRPSDQQDKTGATGLKTSQHQGAPDISTTAEAQTLPVC